MAASSGLPSRYEIRTLGPEHTEWARAIVVHSNVIASPVWPTLYPENKTARLYAAHKAATYLIDHQISSGLSLGIFDKEYTYKRPESAETGGKLYWDADNDTAEAAALTAQMDFPLVSVAMAYDGINPLELPKMMPLIEVLPAFGTLYAALVERDARDPASWQPTEAGQVLMRNATATKFDEEGRGLMKTLARHMMRKAAGEGFRGIQIECAHDAVIHVWAKPPSPFIGHRISEVNCWEYELRNEEDGTTSYPLRPGKQDIVKIYVDLKP